MKFDDFYAERLAAGLTDTAANRSLCQAAWDTAICSATAACLERGKPREGPAIMAALSDLHTWTQTEHTS